jgi:hypothetical protein
MTAGTANVTGERLVNFDLMVVAPNGAVPISYNRASNSCSLVCHGASHSANGQVTAQAMRGTGLKF